MKNNELVKSFGARVGIPSLSLGSEGVAALTVGKDLEIQLEGPVDGERLNINGMVGALRSVESSFLLALLEANHNGVATGGGAISIDPRTTEIVLTWTLLTTQESVDSFAKKMEDFARYLTFWIDYLPKISTGSNNADPAFNSEVMLRI